MNRARKIGLATPLIMLLLGSGCHQKPLEKVTGRITLDGQPVPEGTVVEFIPENGRPSEARTDVNGAFELQHTLRRSGSSIGPHKVRISSWRQEQLHSNGKVTPLRPESIPAEYNYHSELTFHVESGKDNVANFELKSGGKIIQPPK
ncbi:hypothetical protein [Planctomicrobium sp. SH664]|uniref:hypothetical protein n=1 Tax=Planctomicrobium sp. SH664 TaxID=3448125 RepID=UPI003F5BB3AB